MVVKQSGLDFCNYLFGITEIYTDTHTYKIQQLFHNFDNNENK